MLLLRLFEGLPTFRKFCLREEAKFSTSARPFDGGKGEGKKERGCRKHIRKVTKHPWRVHVVIPKRGVANEEKSGFKLTHLRNPERGLAMLGNILLGPKCRYGKMERPKLAG